MDTPLPEGEEIDPVWWLLHTRDLSADWCPGCEPDRNPLTNILVEVWCQRHKPSLEGDKDGAMMTPEPVWPVEFGLF